MPWPGTRRDCRGWSPKRATMMSTSGGAPSAGPRGMGRTIGRGGDRGRLGLRARALSGGLPQCMLAVTHILITAKLMARWTVNACQNPMAHSTTG